MFRQRQPGLGDLDLAEDEILPLRVHLDPGPVAELTAHDGLGQWVLDELLDRAPELPRAVGRVVPLLDQEVEGGLGRLDLDALLARAGC